MNIEVLIAIRSEGKKDIQAILSFVGLASNALVYVYHYNGSKEESFAFGGHNVTVHYGTAKTKIAAYNWLLSNASSDAALFVDSNERLVDGYIDLIEKAFQRGPKADGIVFDYSKETKRASYKAKPFMPLANLCVRTEVVKLRQLTFIDVDDQGLFDGPVQAFIRECLAWPSRCVGCSESLLMRSKDAGLDITNLAFLDSHRFGALWLVLCLVRFFQMKKDGRPPFKPFLQDYKHGRQAYIYRGYEDENKPIKQNPLPFIVLCISMLGLAVQLVLSLLIVFTEVQYIPIWVSLVFIVLFAVAYALVSPKIHNAKVILINGLSIATSSFVAGLVTYLAMNVSWAMSLYGAFICGVIVLGLMYCFAPLRVRKR